MEFIALSLEKPKRIIDRVFIHCSASDNPKHDDVSVIKEWHLARVPPFSDVGYHFFIKSNGEVQRGRDINITPAAQEGNNAHTIAICLHGLTTFTDDQFESLRGLCSVIHAWFPKVTFHGHCEVSSKSCPVFDYKQVLNLDKDGRLL